MQEIKSNPIRSVDYKIMKRIFGTIHINALPATGAQIHGDSHAELNNKFLMSKEVDPFLNGKLEAYSLVEATPLYMGDNCKITCRLHVYSPGADYDTTSSQVIVSGNKAVYIAPPCFKLHNDFEVGETVQILPDKHVVLRCIPNTRTKEYIASNHIIHEFYTKLTNKDPFFVLEKGFKVARVIYATTAAGVSWKAYELEYAPTGFKFYMQAAMMCRRIELLPFIT